MRPNNKIKKLIEGLKIIPSAELDAKVNSAIEDALAERKRIDSADKPGIWRIIMKSSITKLAAAAIIIAAVLAGIYFITGKTPEVTCCAWAQIADRIEQFKTCVCRTHILQTGGPQGTQEVDVMMYTSSEFGNRMDTYIDGNLMMQAYVLPDENTMISVIPPAKKYTRMLLTDEYMTKMKQQGQDPSDMVKNLMLGEYTELGRETIDGIEVEGIEVVNPPPVRGVYDNFVGKLWVDVTTELPVRLEFEAQISAGVDKINLSMVMDEFEWDAELDPTIFEPNIPEDYTMMAEMKMPTLDEGSAIEGLRVFAELSEGRYPSQMNMTTVMRETEEAIRKKTGSDPNKKPQEEQMQQMITILASSQFYNELAQQGKDTAYYGKDVTAGDANAVLMRWKISDDTYMVLFGDLTAENVTPEQLAELEKDLTAEREEPNTSAGAPEPEKLIEEAEQISGEKIPKDKRGLVARMLGLSEEDLIKGLGVFAELSAGRYPNRMDSRTMMQEIESLIKTKYGTAGADSKEAKDKVLDIFFAAAFYETLARENRDVRYYGDKVTSKNADAVLMRWKLSGNTYRVVFGNLAARNLPAEQLREMEQAAQQ